MSSSSKNKSSQSTANSQTTTNTDNSQNVSGGSTVITGSTIQDLDAAAVDSALDFGKSIAAENSGVVKAVAAENSGVVKSALDFSTGLADQVIEGYTGTIRDVAAAYQKSQADAAAYQAQITNDFRALAEGSQDTLRDALATALNSKVLAEPADKGAPTAPAGAPADNKPLIWAGLALAGLVFWK